MTMTDYIDTVHDRQMARVGDEYEDKYAPNWVEDINTFLSNYSLRIVQVLENSAGVAAQVVYETDGYRKYYMTAWQPTEDDLYKLVYETLEFVINLEGDFPVNIFSSPLFEFLSGEMIGEADVTLTVKDVKLEELTNSRGKEEKPVMTFKERKKKLVLNKTNARVMADQAGPETDNWRDLRVVLHAPYIDAFGKRVRSVRVKDVLKPAKKRGAKNVKAVQQAEEVADKPLFDEEE